MTVLIDHPKQGLVHTISAADLLEAIRENGRRAVEDWCIANRNEAPVEVRPADTDEAVRRIDEAFDRGLNGEAG